MTATESMCPVGQKPGWRIPTKRGLAEGRLADVPLDEHVPALHLRRVHGGCDGVDRVARPAVCHGLFFE